MLLMMYMYSALKYQLIQNEQQDVKRSKLTIFQCFRRTAPLRESRVTFREGPQKNGERANLPFTFTRLHAGLTQA